MHFIENASTKRVVLTEEYYGKKSGIKSRVVCQEEKRGIERKKRIDKRRLGLEEKRNVC